MMQDEIWNEFDGLVRRTPWVVRGIAVAVGLLVSLIPLAMAFHASSF